MNNHLGIGVNGCGRTKHICGGAEGEEARRDRHAILGMPGVDGTSVKSPKPYLMPDQLNLTMAIAGAINEHQVRQEWTR